MNEDLNKAFTHIYNNTYKQVFGYVISKIHNIHDTNDVLQTIYMALYKRMSNKGILPVEQALKILYTSAKHEIGRYYGFISKQKRIIPLFTEQENRNYKLDFENDTFLISLENFNNRELLDEICSYIYNKDMITYRAFLLHYICGFTFKECAELLPCSYSSLIHKIYRILDEIKIKFKEEIQNEGK